jgi:hypothetical protein
MSAARAQAFTAVTDGGAAAPRSQAMAAEGAVLASGRVAVRLQPVGDPVRPGSAGKICDWVRRRLR